MQCSGNPPRSFERYDWMPVASSDAGSTRPRPAELVEGRRGVCL